MSAFIIHDLTCREVADFLMDYLGHELTAENRAAFEAHLQQCEECVLYIRQYEQTVRLGKDACEAEEPVPRELVQAILAARKKSR